MMLTLGELCNITYAQLKMDKKEIDKIKEKSKREAELFFALMSEESQRKHTVIEECIKKLNDAGVVFRIAVLNEIPPTGKEAAWVCDSSINLVEKDESGEITEQGTKDIMHWSSLVTAGLFNAFSAGQKYGDTKMTNHELFEFYINYIRDSINYSIGYTFDLDDHEYGNVKKGNPDEY